VIERPSTGGLRGRGTGNSSGTGGSADSRSKGSRVGRSGRPGARRRMDRDSGRRLLLLGDQNRMPVRGTQSQSAGGRVLLLEHGSVVVKQLALRATGPPVPNPSKLRFSARPNAPHGPHDGAHHGRSRRGPRGRSIRAHNPVRVRDRGGLHVAHVTARIHPSGRRVRDGRDHRGNNRHGHHASRKHGHSRARERAHDRRVGHMAS
jgi:hypothetical protein